MAQFNSGKHLGVVIQLQKADQKEVLARLDKDTSKIFGRGRYAYILHDRDMLDSGEPKSPHIHMVFHAEIAKSSANWVAFFSDALGVEKDAVSVEMLGFERKLVRYLLHLDDADKAQYDRSQVVTNMPDTCKKAWEASTGFVSNPTLEQLEEAYNAGARALYNLVGMASFEKASRVVERIVGESEYVTNIVNEVKRLYSFLASMTAKKEYVLKGYIPLKDFTDMLGACSDTLEELVALERNGRNKK